MTSASGVLTPEDEDKPHPSSRQPLLVGVTLTYPNNNGATISKTWGAQVQNLLFFSSSMNEGASEHDPPMVSLPGNHDNHLKARRPNPYHMLKYFHDKAVHDYDWFLWANDETYVRLELLNKFLSQLDAHHDLCFSPANLGGQKVSNLQEEHRYYGVGGPGTIFSRMLLKKLVPHIEECLVNRTTKKTDVDIERCIQQRVVFQCTKSNEVRFCV